MDMFWSDLYRESDEELCDILPQNKEDTRDSISLEQMRIKVNDNDDKIQNIRESPKSHINEEFVTIQSASGLNTEESYGIDNDNPFLTMQSPIEIKFRNETSSSQKRENEQLVNLIKEQKLCEYETLLRKQAYEEFLKREEKSEFERNREEDIRQTDVKKKVYDMIRKMDTPKKSDILKEQTDFLEIQNRKQSESEKALNIQLKLYQKEPINISKCSKTGSSPKLDIFDFEEEGIKDKKSVSKVKEPPRNLRRSSRTRKAPQRYINITNEKSKKQMRKSRKSKNKVLDDSKSLK